MAKTALHDTRRTFLKTAGTAMSGGAIAPAFMRANAGIAAQAADVSETGAMEGVTASVPADVTLRIGPVMVEMAKGRTISTTGYNGSSPGPLPNAVA